MLSTALAPQERQHYTAYYQTLLQKRLVWAADYLRAQAQPNAILEHLASWLQLLRQAHLYPTLHPLVIEVVKLLQHWPIHWGYAGEWEQELRFTIPLAARLNLAHRQAELQANLINILYLAGRWDELLAEGETALAGAQACGAWEALVYIGKIMISVLFSREQKAAAAHYTALIDQMLQQAEGPNAPLAQLLWKAFNIRDLRYQGQWAAALDLASQVIEQMAALPDIHPNILADAYVDRSNLHWACDAYAASAQDLHQAINLVAQQGYRFAEMAMRGNLGVTYWSMGELPAAKAVLGECIQMSEQLHMYWRLAYDVGTLALVYLAQGQFAEALMLAERHLALSRKTQYPFEIARAQGNCATIRLCLGQYQRARQELEEEFIFNERNNPPRAQVPTLTSLSWCYHLLGQTAKAWAYAEQAYQSAQPEFPSLRIVALRNLAYLHPPETRAPLLREALALAQQCQRKLDIAACLLSLAELAAQPVEQNALWKAGADILYAIEASAWLQNCSPRQPPRIIPLA